MAEYFQTVNEDGSGDLLVRDMLSGLVERAHDIRLAGQSLQAVEVEEELADGREADLLAELKLIDPESAERVKDNPRRLIRAVQVVRVTGVPEIDILLGDLRDDVSNMNKVDPLMGGNLLVFRFLSEYSKIFRFIRELEKLLEDQGLEPVVLNFEAALIRTRNPRLAKIAVSLNNQPAAQQIIEPIISAEKNTDD